jgi:proline iminopeptidase
VSARPGERVPTALAPTGQELLQTSGLSRRRILECALFASAISASGRSAAARHSAPKDAAAQDPASKDPAAVRTGGARMVPISGGFQVWAKPVALRSDRIPVLTLHGGPGFPHFYFECFEDFLPQAGIGYWYYDQLGCGFSDQPKDDSLWNTARFTAELEEVRAGLKLDRMVLLGHSWGGILAIEYALAHPERLAGLVISNMTASIASYLERIGKLRQELPPAQARRLGELEAAKAYDSPEYEEIVFDVLYRKHICRLDPWPEPVSRAVRFLSAPVYNAMQGRSEFEVTGTLKGWDRWADLSRISCPTLILGGRYDTMNPDDLVRMSRRMPNASTFICERGSHLSMYDDQRAYFSALLPFLGHVTRA